MIPVVVKVTSVSLFRQDLIEQLVPFVRRVRKKYTKWRSLASFAFTKKSPHTLIRNSLDSSPIFGNSDGVKSGRTIENQMFSNTRPTLTLIIDARILLPKREIADISSRWLEGSRIKAACTLLKLDVGGRFRDFPSLTDDG